MFGFGAFRATSPLSGGLLWKIPWRLSKFQKARQRRRLRAVDSVIATLDAALNKQGETLKSLDLWKQEMPTEAEMLPKDKYTMFDRKEKRYRKGIHNDGLDSNVLRITQLNFPRLVAFGRGPV
ncbi:putative Mitochondrial ribosomal protein L31-domain-containing protein [Seiridium unicorne]|uniref:Mitochondrial ribosomal protein L31-domain-containing protein n=1 Tax=Seiridium unicorne TaxID=138068 RepID=A0ABR2UIF7_9PEZI